jgi:hypothetical protein
VPSLDDPNGTGENDGRLLVRVFADDQIDVLRVHLAMGATPNYLNIATTPSFCPG